MSPKACVIGAGPNGLAAAIVLAQAGLQVEVLEAQPTAGGAVRTLELTLPGFQHDFGSAVYPLGAGSPFFSSLPLRDHGLEWIHSPAALAHPLDDGTAVVLERDLFETRNSLGSDGAMWDSLMRPFVERWSEFALEILRPISLFPKHPFLMGRFGMVAMLPSQVVARRFQSNRTRALFAGLAAHSFLALDEPLTAAFAILLTVAAHAVGWPIPRGGAQSLTNAMCAYLSTLGTQVKTSSPVGNLSEVTNYDLLLCDLTPRQLSKIGGESLSRSYKRKLESFRYGAAAFKVDYALSAPIPWKDTDCRRAASVHLGGSFEEIAASEKAVRNGQHPERPFVLLAQPSLFDNSRAPAGKHTAWAYCHVPNGSKINMLERVENQIERFAPGFRECILARRVFTPADLEGMDANLVGGDIGGGIMDIRQLLFRPTWRHYATSARNIYICSSSTPPGGGVHGMCGSLAAKMAMSRLSLH
ncbi:MAG TPA: NAD(P)/FAD-dependent oxidoreductase [Candidatus Aquilonibacter sp.]|jgi:phytoene dehydrogenase-like protein|nr:NAD(P)/FAD-dependent oxidoreductase [Candidatus Aquilonibacter sp.]